MGSPNINPTNLPNTMIPTMNITGTTGNVPQTTKRSVHILQKNRIIELLKQVDPQLNFEGEESIKVLQTIAEEFIDNVLYYSHKIAKHRNSNCVEAKDVAVHLDMYWNIRVPGYMPDQPPDNPNNDSNHQKRLESIRKSKN